MSAFPMACNIAHARNVKNAHLAHKTELRKKEDILLKVHTPGVHKHQHQQLHYDSHVIQHAFKADGSTKMPINNTAMTATQHTSAAPSPLVSTIPVIELTANFRNVLQQLKGINTDELIRKTFGSNHN